MKAKSLQPKRTLHTVLLVLLFAFFTPKEVLGQETLTVFDGTATNSIVPIYVTYFDEYTKSQYVIPAAELADMAGRGILSIKYYTTSNNIPYTTLSPVDIYVKEVDYTILTAYEDKADCQVVYSGTVDFVATVDGGECVISFTTPYEYQGGNLLIGCENTTCTNWKSISFYGQNLGNGVSAGAHNGSGTSNIGFTARNFMPKVTFDYSLYYPKPKNIIVTDKNEGSATLEWTISQGENTLTGYAYQYKAAGEEWPAEWTNLEAAVTSVTLEGLTANTCYNFRIKALYGDIESAMATASFNTYLPTSLPITFADANVKAICLTNWDTDGDGELSYVEADAVTDLGWAFRDNANITSFDELQYFTSLTSVGNYAFYRCISLTSIVIPNSVTSIGYGAFYSCDLTSVEIPSSVTSIGNYAFSFCSSLTSIEIPNSVDSIGSGTFYDCRSLTTIVIPNSISSIGYHAFSNCSGLTSMTVLADTPPTLGNSVFEGVEVSFRAYVLCGLLEDYLSAEGWSEVRTREMCDGTITATVNPAESGTISGTGSYAGGETCTLVAIPNEGFAFINWKENGEVVSVEASYSFPASGDRTLVAYFGSSAPIVFADANVKAVCVANWDSNDDGELSYAEAEVVTNLGRVFQSNNTITSFYELQYFTSLISIGDNEFRSCTNLTTIGIPNSVTSIGTLAFFGCDSLTSIAIPNSVTSIESYAFSGCRGLSTIELPNSLTSIGASTFSSCSGLTSIELPNSLTSIGSSAFSGCEGLTTIELPNSLTSIGASTFSYCSGLASIVIPNSVTFIGDNAFFSCSSLTLMKVLADTPPTLGVNVFKGIKTFFCAYVPCGSLEDYQIANGWHKVRTREMCDGTITATVNPSESGSVSGMGSYVGGETCTVVAAPNDGFAFSNWKENGEVVSIEASYSFPASGDRAMVANFGSTAPIVFADANVKAICVANWDINGDGELSYAEAAAVTDLGWGTFQGNENIISYDELQYFTSLTSIGNDAFSNCSGLTSITIPNSVTFIDGNAFFGCSGLTAIEIPNSVTIIGPQAFTGCCGLISIEIPNSVTFIDFGAFNGCSGLTSIAIPNSVTVIGDAAFFSCSGLISIEIPDSCVSIGWSAFGSCTSLTMITSYATIPPTLETNAFDNVSTTAVVNVPCGTASTYQATSGWDYFSNYDEMCTFNFITAGNWSTAANWESGSLPGENDEVFINADCNLDMDVTVRELTISSGNTLTINSGTTLSVTNTLTNNGGSAANLVVADGGQLFTGNTVNGTIQKSILGYGESEDGYYFIASPVDDFNPNDGGLLTSSYDLYYFDQAQEGEEWRNYEAASFNLNTGKGYLYASQTDVTLNISGELTAAKDPVELVNQTGVAFEGWNLIGNPYPCNVTINVPFYRMYSDGSGLATQTTNLETTAIKPMEGVFVQYTTEAPSVTFTKAPNVSAEGSRGALNLSLGQGRGVKDNAIIRFDGGKTLEKFNLRKGSSIFITEGNKDYAVVNAEKQGEIPVSFKTEKNGSYTLSFSNEDVEFSYLHLIDNMTGNDVDLLHTPSYSFEAKTMDYASRFRLVFSTDGNANDESFGFVNAMGNFCIYGIEGDATVQVIDAMGRILSSETFSGSCEKQLGGGAGVYVVRLINGDKVRTQKIVVR